MRLHLSQRKEVGNSMRKWQIHIFILCWIAYACAYFGRVNLSIAIPEIQNNLGWSKAHLGLIGSVFFWVYGIGQMINGYIGDKVSSRWFIFIGLAIAGAANFLFGFTFGLSIMMLLWAVNGYFQSMLWGPIAKTLSSWFSYEKRSMVSIAISTSMVGGYILSWGLASQILKYFNWRWTFWLPGICIILFSFVWFFGIKVHPKEIGLRSPNVWDAQSGSLSKENKDEGISKSLSLWNIILKTRLGLVVLACFAQGIVKDGIALWGPTFLMETQKLDLTLAVKLAMIIPFLNFGGMMFAGWLNKKVKYQEKLATAILLLAGMVMIFILILVSGISLILGLIFLGMASAMMYGANTLLLGVVPMGFAKYNKVSAVAGFLDFCSYIASGFAVAITGRIVDSFGWNNVLILWAIVALIGILSLIIGWRNEDKGSHEL